MTLFLFLLACSKPCEYTARCDGSVLETCSLGVDQLFGSGESETNCPDTVNPVCHSPEPDVAFCTLDDEIMCEEGATRCDGDIAITCNESGFEVGQDCTTFGPTCVLNEGEAQCALDPVESCDNATYERSCEGIDLIVCNGGLVTQRVCDDDKVCGLNDVDALGCVDP